jgi:hypothetical protein
MTLDIDLISGAFFVENDPDVFKAKTWAAEVCKVRVIETPVGVYGALDQGHGTSYFDVGDWLVKIAPLRQILVVGKNMIQALEVNDDDDE